MVLNNYKKKHLLTQLKFSTESKTPLIFLYFANLNTDALKVLKGFSNDNLFFLNSRLFKSLLVSFYAKEVLGHGSFLILPVTDVRMLTGLPSFVKPSIFLSNKFYFLFQRLQNLLYVSFTPLPKVFQIYFNYFFNYFFTYLYRLFAYFGHYHRLNSKL